MTVLLEARGLTRHFPLGRSGNFGRAAALHAVEDVDLVIRAGEAVGLVGESGCGKSTLARMIARLLDPSRGRLMLEGQDILRHRPGAFARSPLRRHVQMVFQDASGSLNPRFTVFDLIADPIRQLLPGPERSLRTRVAEAAAAVHLSEPFLDRYPHQLSEGQKARVGIARAIAVEPKLLVLDEPTSSLDVSVQARVLHLLDGLRRDRGIALLFISHDLNLVRLLCSRILVMYLGQIVETGPADRVFAAPAHPYTRALLSAIPVLGRRLSPRRPLPEMPQGPVAPVASRCRLAGRCPVERADCSRVAPPLSDLADDRQVRCLHPLPLR